MTGIKGNTATNNGKNNRITYYIYNSLMPLRSGFEWCRIEFIHCYAVMRTVGTALFDMQGYPS